MIEQVQAQARAEAFLAERSRSRYASNVRIAQEDCFIDKGRLVAPCNTIDYLDHGVDGARPAGNLPIAVDVDADVDVETGECTFISSEEADDFTDRDLL